MGRKKNIHIKVKRDISCSFDNQLVLSCVCVCVCVCVRVCVSPSDSATLLVVDLDEFSEAAGVVVVGRLSVPKGLRRQQRHVSVETGDR